jgi:hypothetical protein
VIPHPASHCICALRRVQLLKMYYYICLCFSHDGSRQSSTTAIALPSCSLKHPTARISRVDADTSLCKTKTHKTRNRGVLVPFTVPLASILQNLTPVSHTHLRLAPLQEGRCRHRPCWQQATYKLIGRGTLRPRIARTLSTVDFLFCALLFFAFRGHIPLHVRDVIVFRQIAVLLQVWSLMLGHRSNQIIDDLVWNK